MPYKVALRNTPAGLRRTTRTRAHWAEFDQAGIFTGTGGVVFARPTLDATGTALLAITGTGAVAIANPTLAATGSSLLAITGSGGVTLAAPALAGTGTAGAPAVTGTGATTIQKPILGGSASQTFSGTGAVTIAKPALSGAAVESFTASGAVTITRPVLSGTGTALLAITGTGAVTIARPTLAGTGSGGATTYLGEVLEDAPSRYFRLGESTGTVADDAGSSAQDGDYVGGYTLAQPSGIIADADTSVVLNGSTGRIDIGVTTLEASMTVEAWIKTTTGGLMPILSTRPAAGERCYIGLNDGVPFVFVALGTPSVFNGVGAVNDGAWHHVVFTNDGTTTKSYIDGVLDASSGQTRAPSTSDSNIGHDPDNNQWWNGTLDEVAIYPTVLSGARDLAHYDAGAGVGGATVFGTVAVTIARPALAGAGVETLTGSGATTVTRPILSGAGTALLAITGTSTATLARPTLTGAGLETFAGVGAATIARPTLAGAGVLAFTGSGGVAFARPVLAGIGEVGADLSEPLETIIGPSRLLVVTGEAYALEVAAGARVLIVTGGGR